MNHLHVLKVMAKHCTHKRKDKARSHLTIIVNALTAKLEIGGPMASLCLLWNSDHYTNHTFESIIVLQC